MLLMMLYCMVIARQPFANTEAADIKMLPFKIGIHLLDAFFHWEFMLNWVLGEKWAESTGSPQSQHSLDTILDPTQTGELLRHAHLRAREWGVMGGGGGSDGG